MGDKEEPMEEDWEYYDENLVLPDFWQKYISEDLDTKDPIPAWLNFFTKPYEQKYGWNMYREFWRIWVPILLAPRNGTTSVDQFSEVDERRIQEVLISPLEKFICGGEKVDEVLKTLSANDSPSIICGHVFKQGETCYSCRDCGQDATCVMCVQCFTNSSHKEHKYKMAVSDGGGFCDCGDEEAFTSDPTCSIHTQKDQSAQTPAQIMEQFPEDLKNRARDLLYNVCVYCINVISDTKGQDDLVPGGKEMEVFDDLKFPFKFSKYCTVLLNDDSHSYQDVTRVLTKVLPKVTSKTSADLTTYVDKHGKAVIKVGNYQDCEQVSKKIESLTRASYSSVLKSTVVKSYAIAHQAYVARLLKWIPTLLERSSGFRAIFSEVMLMDSPETNVTVKRHNLSGGGTSSKKFSICEAILLNDVNSWKEVRSLWLSLVINGLLKDYESKKELATIFTRTYPQILSDFMADDQERDSSIMTLSVQIFTVPSLSCHLIENCDGLSNLLEGFVNLISNQLNQEGKLTWMEEEKNEFSRGLHGLNDVTYLLSVVPSAEWWTDKLRNSFNRGLKKILEVLSMMQGMDSMKRQVGSHVEMEDSDWKNAYELTSYFGDIVRLMVNWAVSDKAVLLHAIRATIQMVASNHEKLGRKETTKHLAFLGAPKTYNVVDFDVSKHVVSVHTPLHRFLANLMAEVSRYDLEVNLKSRIENEISLQHLIEPILQVTVTVSQIEIGMWRRNGSSAEGQAYIYLSSKYCPGLKEADLLLLQLTAAITDDMDDFLVWMITRFQLAKWTTGEIDSQGSFHQEREMEDTMIEWCNGLAEDWLSLITAMLSERSSSKVGTGASIRSAVRKEVIQMLCIEPMPHSALVKRLPERKDMDKIVDEVIAEVAELKTSSKTAGKKVYHLKSGLEHEYNLFYAGYNKEQQSAAQEAQISMRKSKGDCCPPPPLQPLTKLFSGLVRVAQSQVTLQACAVTLRRITSSGTISRYVTETQVHKVLYLLALALREPKRPGYDFLEKAEKAGIWALVEKLVKEEPRDLPDHVKMLAGWVKNTAEDMKRETKGEATVAVEESGSNQEEIANAELARKKKAAAAAARKAKIMAQMTAMQKNFAAENAAMLDGMEESDATETSETTVKSVARETVCLGPQQSSRHESVKRYQCIYCQEEGKVGSGPAMVMAAHLQKSTVLSHRPSWDGSAPLTAPQVSPHHLAATRDCGPHISTCGHAMHASCYQKFFDAQVSKERDRNISMLTRSLNFDVNSYEFLCPICERLSNTVLPIIPSVSHLRKKQTSCSPSEIGLNSWIKALKSSVESWYLKDDSLEEPTLPRMSLKTSLEEQAAQHGKQFAACFQPASDCDGSPVENDLYEMMNVFSIAAFTTSLDLNPHEEDYRVPLISLQAAAFTIEGMERMLDLDDRPLFGGLNGRDEDLLKYVSRFIATFASSYSKPPGSSTMREVVKKIKGFYRLKSLQSNAVFLLASLLADNNPMGSCHLNLDSFGMLVSLLISLPCIFDSDHPPRLPTGQGMELYCLKLCLMQHIIQVLLNTSSQKYEELSDSNLSRSTNNDNLIHKLLTCAVGKTDLKIDLKRINSTKILAYLQTAVMPFLRCSALLFSNCTDVPPGIEVMEDGGRSYGPLARYLGLPPTLDNFLDSPPTKTLAEFIYLHKQPAKDSDEDMEEPEDKCIKNLNFPLTFRKMIPPSVVDAKIKPLYPLANLTKDPNWKGGLIPLPRDYTDLMNLAARFVCNNSVTGESKTPTLCLICGLLVCSQSHCCETVLDGTKCNGCTYHARVCAADTGVYLRIRECMIILQNKVTRGCFLNAPYLDEYGEADSRLKRGNPLYLDTEKYEELNRMWVKNEVPEKIARTFDPEILILLDWNSL